MQGKKDVFSYVDLDTLSHVSLACAQDDVPKLKELLSRDYPVDVKDNQGRLPIHIAAIKGFTSCLSVLISNSKEHVNFLCFEGMSPLLYAAKNDKLSAAKLLIESGSSPNVIDSYGNNALDYALERNNFEMFEYLTGFCDPNASSYEGWTTLHNCALAGNTKFMSLLISDKKCKFSKTDSGVTPLHLACQQKHVHCAKLLIESMKPNINCLTDDGTTPLMLASQSGCLETVRLLLDKGASVNLSNCNGTALHSALIPGSVDIVELLLERGADVEGEYYNNNISVDTPLTQAIFNNNIDCATALLKHGASPLTKSSYWKALCPLDATFDILSVDSLLPEGKDVLIMLIKHAKSKEFLKSIPSLLFKHLLLKENFDLIDFLLQHISFESSFTDEVLSVIIDNYYFKSLVHLVNLNYPISAVSIHSFFQHINTSSLHPALYTSGFLQIYCCLLLDQFSSIPFSVISEVKELQSQVAGISVDDYVLKPLSHLCRIKLRILLPSGKKFKSVLRNLVSNETLLNFLTFEQETMSLLSKATKLPSVFFNQQVEQNWEVM